MRCAFFVWAVVGLHVAHVEVSPASESTPVAEPTRSWFTPVAWARTLAWNVGGRYGASWVVAILERLGWTCADQQAWLTYWGFPGWLDELCPAEALTAEQASVLFDVTRARLDGECDDCALDVEWLESLVAEHLAWIDALAGTEASGALEAMHQVLQDPRVLALARDPQARAAVEQWHLAVGSAGWSSGAWLLTPRQAEVVHSVGREAAPLRKGGGGGAWDLEDIFAGEENDDIFRSPSARIVRGASPAPAVVLPCGLGAPCLVDKTRPDSRSDEASDDASDEASLRLVEDEVEDKALVRTQTSPIDASQADDEDADDEADEDWDDAEAWWDSALNRWEAGYHHEARAVTSSGASEDLQDSDQHAEDADQDSEDAEDAEAAIAEVHSDLADLAADLQHVSGAAAEDLLHARGFEVDESEDEDGSDDEGGMVARRMRFFNSIAGVLKKRKTCQVGSGPCMATMRQRGGARTRVCTPYLRLSMPVTNVCPCNTRYNDGTHDQGKAACCGAGCPTQRVLQGDGRFD